MLRSLFIASICATLLTPPAHARAASPRQQIVVILPQPGSARDDVARRIIKSAPEIAGADIVLLQEAPAPQVASWWDTVGRGAPENVSAQSASEAKRPAPTEGAAAYSADGVELLRISASALVAPDGASKLWQALDQATGKLERAQYNIPKPGAAAVDGYDVVEYFQSQRPTKGDEKIIARYHGVTYRFSSESNRAAFRADPQRFLPTYGGWCASAMGAKGEKVEIDPTNFKIKDGRLHLFYKSFFANALNDWNKHEVEWEPAADANWLRISGEAPRVVKGGDQ